ncbi:MAG: hypothetical protein AAFQ51_14535 [Pseudomonadota bacterium]
MSNAAQLLGFAARSNTEIAALRKDFGAADVPKGASLPARTSGVIGGSGAGNYVLLLHIKVFEMRSARLSAFRVDPIVLKPRDAEMVPTSAKQFRNMVARLAPHCQNFNLRRRLDL